MTCARCQGYLIRERFSDLSAIAGEDGVAGWRCINCGDVFDRVVLDHRTAGAVVPYRSQRRWAGESRRARRAGAAMEPVECGDNIVVA
jgi:hypothetical protein